MFKRAVRDRVVGYNPCADTELPKVIPAKVHILAPEDFDRLLAEIPARYEALVLTAIETGLRWVSWSRSGRATSTSCVG